MCGIAGILDRTAPPSSALVARMLEVISHRGPDGCGSWSDHNVALGHRRLAIIDLSHHAAQPMHYAEDRYVISYNGEVYNYIELRAELEGLGHQFRSSSDTEVILASWAEWGPEALSRCNGMFAFALWDRREQTLFLARDRIGVKPLCYTWDGRRLAFASEAKALHAAGLLSGRMNHDAVYEYLARGYTSGGRSMHAGVEMVEPGTVVMLAPGRPLRTWSWWEPDRSEDSSSTSQSEWCEEVAYLIEDAVRLRLRSDVPVGAHLSGGLDSSAIVAAAARSGGSQITAFTGAFCDDKESDERPFARSLASHVGVPIREIEMSIDQLPGEFSRLLWHMDEPIAGPGVFPQLMVCELTRSAGVTVVLGGQGGDELFGGYLRHRALHFKRAAQQGSPWHRVSAALQLAALAVRHAKRVRRTATRVRDEDLAPAFLAQVDPVFRAEMRMSPLAVSSARELLWHDLRAYLPALLHVEDRTSMALSLESRTPLLDYRLVELMLRVPESLLFAAGQPKPLLHQAVASWLPADVAKRRDKRGFPTPLHHWQRRPSMAALVNELTSSASSPMIGAWDVPGELDGGVFSDAYLAQRYTLQASELWTVMTVNGWLSQLEHGAFAAQFEAAA